MTPAELDTHRRERLASAERRVSFLEGERGRLERLLAYALRVAVGGTNVQPAELLEAIARLDEFAPPAPVDELAPLWDWGA
jgi:hypothetical protein